MNREDLRAIVLEALHRVAPEADLTQLPLDADLRSTLDLDSFSMLQVLVALHQKLGVDIPEADAGGLATVERMIDYLHQRLAAAKAPSPGA